MGAKCVRVDNRKVLFLGLVFSAVGSLLFGDWQAILGDPCLAQSQNTTLYYITDEAMPPTVEEGSGEIILSTLDSCTVESFTNSSLVLELIESCRALSNSENTCFWSRQSRVTGKYCYSCLGVCLSIQSSHNIYQFSVGVIFISIAASLLFVFSSAIVSDIASVKSQVSVNSS